MTEPAISEELIGRESEEVLIEVERGAIRKFAEAVGDTTAACVRGDVAPPTFPLRFESRFPASRSTCRVSSMAPRSTDSSGPFGQKTACDAGAASPTSTSGRDESVR